ncbi:hypothetical protein PGT21_032317 [Puccinia graminis f. sp. tritici]|uniref:Uncharacterized protein n=1 Tax=Puccinia graminis f. sp. tritici TaxID=56615 RepID=A0A5B0PAK1_PUCGR|nr:hypothetical protein PGT21_032317 [Puccinia graminis f. sp. tritici]KAA1107906.1 hypothetical protein PGTUg99_006733 [Puccinia graminis f. sp. tritici]
MAVMEDELQRLWQLLAELSSQLTQNREQTEQLKKQAQELKTQAIHTGTGYPLKRFNVDLSKEQFESELERMNAQLVIENQTLQHENRHLTILLKDHETTLEQIMNRFRNHAHSTQQHELELTKYYESILLSLLEKQQQQQQQRYPNDGHPTELDPNTFQLIQNLSILIQKAIRELSGEEPYLSEADELESQQALIQAELSHQQSQTPTSTEPPPSPFAFQDPFKNPSPPPTHQSSSTNQPKIIDPEQRRKSMSVIDYRPRLRDPSSGGYVGKRNGSLSDHALLSAIESERLRRENACLREMLGIATDDCGPIQPSAVHQHPPTHHHHHHHQEHSLTGNLHTVVSQVIKEEDEDPLHDLNHPPPPPPINPDLHQILPPPPPPPPQQEQEESEQQVPKDQIGSSEQVGSSSLDDVDAAQNHDSHQLPA